MPPMRIKSSRDQGPPQADLRTLTLMLTVSIFIALLAFFIVLNCFSATSMVKASRVTQAIHGAFGLGIGLSDEVTEDYDRAGTGDIEESVSTGLRAVLPDVGFEARQTASGGSIMAVDIKIEDMEERWAALRGRFGDVVNRGQGRHALQILALDGPGRAGMLAGLARELADVEGVSPQMMSIGYEERGRAVIEFRFVPAGK